MPTRLCIAVECRGNGSHGKSRGVAARRLPHLEKGSNHAGSTSLSRSLFLSPFLLSSISVLVISGRNLELGRHRWTLNAMMPLVGDFAQDVGMRPVYPFSVMRDRKRRSHPAETTAVRSLYRDRISSEYNLKLYE